MCGGGVAHCPFEKLADIRGVLDEIRGWPGIREPKPGIFYFKRTPFLHFHIGKEQRRWADVRNGKDWGPEVEISIDASHVVQSRFLREVKRRYAAMEQSKPKL
jgi:hypothetical protein